MSLARFSLPQRLRRPPVLPPPAGRAQDRCPHRGAATRSVTVLTAVAAALVAISPPAGVFMAGRAHVEAALEASAALHAVEVAEMARTNPAIWQSDALQIPAPSRGRAADELRRVYDVAGRLVMESRPARPVAWPIASRLEAVQVGGVRMGDAEATRSLRGVLLGTLLASLLSGALGILVFLLLRVLPIRRMDAALRRASHLATHDLLTGLPNRVHFADRLDRAMARARRQNGAAAVLCLDLKRFKSVNDTLGHAAGDDLLKEISRRLEACLGRDDMLARLGGNEFAVLQMPAVQPQAADALARRLMAAVAEPVVLSGGQAVVGLSIGIALATPAGSAECGPAYDPAVLMQNAHLALCQSKQGSRGAPCFFDPEMNHRLREKRSLEIDLRQAVERGEFRLAFQPQYSLEQQRVSGAEALLRWTRPGHGNMPPDQFIPLAEETGLIAPIGAWVLEEACRCAVAWPGELGIAVNVSPAQFRQGGLEEAVEAALARSGLAASRLELEITEGVLMHDTEETLDMLQRLRRRGVRIAVDDFGTGYSSLGYLQKFPFDKVKIDRSFIQRLGQDASAGAIVRAVVGMSHALGVRANAEGVELREQAELLCAEGCEEVQGYLFGRPMPAAEFLRLVDTTTVAEAVGAA
ncbi:putative bifunctional diguanylate cyclase/phosphodiesterase [Pseudoroseomonas globiformis]|uniref:Bifunctional diguanylate cyclase/phosphodiesterase n=1 Tax=Teichococcus globiformis TaxID=2307229 RepID=A0ABV7FU57_9PROT